MGKNNSKKKARVEFSRWTGIMRKLDNKLKNDLEMRKNSSKIGNKKA